VINTNYILSRTVSLTAREQNAFSVSCMRFASAIEIISIVGLITLYTECCIVNVGTPFQGRLSESY